MLLFVQKSYHTLCLETHTCTVSDFQSKCENGRMKLEK